MKLIFAQGNPEPEYNGFRHNVGFAVLNSLSDYYDVKWTSSTKCKALIAETTIDGEKVILAKPMTFYNDTGVSARKLIDFYKIDAENDMLIIHDDLALPFGTVRIRKQGGDAGNNGIKSINQHINSPYTRIKIGIRNEMVGQIGDSDFVLAKFSRKESEQLEKTIIPHVVKLIVHFVNNSLEHTSYTVSSDTA